MHRPEELKRKPWSWFKTPTTKKNSTAESKSCSKKRYPEFLRQKNLKNQILSFQKTIAKLEIQNNLLRKEIHNSQFERIKLLKKTNEAKNSFDQLQWEGEKTRQQSKGTQG